LAIVMFGSDGGGAKTILIIEDDAATAELERRVVQRSGMNAHIVSRVDDALAVLAQKSFAAVLLDYHLPDGDPWAVVGAAASKQPRIPVVIVTAQGNERIASEAIHRGVADYVKKTEAFWELLPGILDRVMRLATAEESLRRLEDFFERAQLGAAVVGPHGTFERVNLAFAQMHGFTVEELIGKPVAIAYAPEWRARLPEIFQTVEEQGGLRFAADHVRKDGTVFPVIVDATAIGGASGAPHYRAVYVQDISEQKRAERAGEWKARAVLDAIPDLMFRLDADGVYLDYKAHRSDELYASPDMIIGARTRDLMPPAFAEEILGYIRKTLETGVMQQWEYQLPLAHGLQDFEARMVVCGTNEVLAIVRNITSIKQAERMIQSNLREKDVLLQEVHHRVKNNLQVISSLISMQLRGLGGTGGSLERDALRSCQGRVQAIALVHEKLYQTENYAQVPFSTYAGSLAASIFESTGVSPDAVRLVLAIEAFDLAVDKAIPCGLILNELISNALKHAFPDDRRGVLRVELVKVDRATADLTVADDGQGMAEPLDITTCKSLGMRLVSTLARQLRGRLTVTHQPGVTVRVTFPLSTM
jgi:PAS domain S-box-containing protein